VGTHGIKVSSENTKLQDRLQAHYSGNRRGSSFRKYVYDVLVNSKDLEAATDNQVEQAVSEYIRNLGVVLLSVPDPDDRKFIESNAIALLSRLQPQPGAIDDDCVLNASKEPKIHDSQLWNEQHVGATYDAERLLRELKRYVDHSIQEYETWKIKAGGK
jgi:hypothetical protein